MIKRHSEHDLTLLLSSFPLQIFLAFFSSFYLLPFSVPPSKKCLPLHDKGDFPPCSESSHQYSHPCHIWLHVWYAFGHLPLEGQIFSCSLISALPFLLQPPFWSFQPFPSVSPLLLPVSGELPRWLFSMLKFVVIGLFFILHSSQKWFLSFFFPLIHSFILVLSSFAASLRQLHEFFWELLPYRVLIWQLPGILHSFISILR